MLNIYTDKLIYDNRQNHLYWTANGVDFGSIDYKVNQDQQFQLDYRIPADLKFSDYKTEVQNALIKLYNTHKKILAVCVSGRDSEIIIREAAKLGIPCKMYFLDLWGMNKWMLDIITSISEEIGVELCTVYLSEKECFEEVIFKSYKIMSAIKPTYLCLPYLFENIPEDEFIIVGEGDLAKDNPAFKKYFGPKSTGGIPMLSTEIVYRMWAQENLRYGEFYFHSSTPELVLSAYNDPLFKISPPSLITSQMIEHYWPELKFKIKSLNWEEGPEKNKLIRDILFNLGIQKEQVAGCIVPHSSVVR